MIGISKCLCCYLALLFGIFTLRGCDVASGIPTGGTTEDESTQGPSTSSDPIDLTLRSLPSADFNQNVKHYLDSMREICIILGRLHGFDFRVSDHLATLKYIGEADSVGATVKNNTIVYAELENAYSIDAIVNRMKRRTWSLQFAYQKDRLADVQLSEATASMRATWIINIALQKHVDELSTAIKLLQYSTFKIQLMNTLGCADLNSLESKIFIRALTNQYMSSQPIERITAQEMRSKLAGIMQIVENDSGWTFFQTRILSDLAGNLCINRRMGYYGRFYDPMFCHYDEFRTGIWRWHRLYHALHVHKKQMKKASFAMQILYDWLSMEGMDPDTSQFYVKMGEVLDGAISQFIWSDREKAIFESELSELQPLFEHMVERKASVDAYPSLNAEVGVHKEYFVNNTFNRDPIYHLLMIHYYSELVYFDKCSRHLIVSMVVYARKIRQFPRLPSEDEESRRFKANRIYHQIEKLSGHAEAHMRKMHSIMQHAVASASLNQDTEETYRQCQQELENYLNGLGLTYTAIRSMIVDYLRLIWPSDTADYNMDLTALVRFALPYVVDLTLRAHRVAVANSALFDERTAKLKWNMNSMAKIPIASARTHESACYRDVDSRFGHILSRRLDLHSIFNHLHMSKDDKLYLEIIYESLAGATRASSNKKICKAFKMYLNKRELVQRALQQEIAMPRILELIDQFTNLVHTYRQSFPIITAAVRRCETITAQLESNERMIQNMNPNSTD
ncbi:hypothetical protein BBBOND_0208930 [Babesia bigemina]|uniref:Uncharacterized protein n=1 Tax=Babesia bigemina TaxID=5866 RepID=A0A061DA02_BABBI|nr:hypothetical protein BBBOND_0208930 [Babesia bigemina]CDR95739.1 hypothetical protein BBBOND_0208930 [Babesia bigemina]|eukprot:XP_012767925.1 hypothetical protein BBBOND_0208930 [Babesia bigemina]